MARCYISEQTMNMIDSQQQRFHRQPGRDRRLMTIARIQRAVERTVDNIADNNVDNSVDKTGDRHAGGGVAARFSLGAPAADARLPGGLPVAALHEIYATDPGDRASAHGFALLLALRAVQAAAPGKPLLHIDLSGDGRRQGWLYPPGLAAIGIDPARLILVRVADSLAALRAADSALREPALGAVIALLPGRTVKGLDLTASRRLMLAARRSGVMMLLARSDGGAAPSAAYSRWSVAAAPSRALLAGAPGAPCFAAEMRRHRGGIPPFAYMMEWNRDRTCFTDPAPVAAPTVSDAARAPVFGAALAAAALRAAAAPVRGAA
jgi:protein ImuA